MARKPTVAPMGKAQIASARHVLETARPEEITLKSLALRLGVSQPAPYRHFANRDALLAAVAADGFERFRDSLVAARDETRENEAFLQSCLAYLEFARANRGVYRLMFASQLLREADDEALGPGVGGGLRLPARGCGQDRSARARARHRGVDLVGATRPGHAGGRGPGRRAGERGRQPGGRGAPDDGHPCRPRR